MKNIEAVSWDLETELIRPGAPCPEVVCGIDQPLGGKGRILLKEDAIKTFAEICYGSTAKIVGTYLVFDLSCVAAAQNKLLWKIDEMLFQGRVWDISTAQKIIDLAEGVQTSINPRDGYSLAGISRRILGIVPENKVSISTKDDFELLTRKGKGDNSQWRLRFALLRDIPVEHWPESAKEYCLSDVKFPLDIYLIQKAYFQQYPQLEAERIHRGLLAWYLRLAGVWGIAVNPYFAEQAIAKSEEQHKEHLKFLLKNGIGRQEKKGVVKNTKRIKALVVESYGGSLCGTCNGKWKSTTKQPVCPECNGDKPVNIPEEVPKTQSGDVATDAATLKGSGNDLLLQLYAGGANEKMWSTYVPILRDGVRYGCISPRWNELVNTGRTSCSGPNLQNQHRKGGVRECLVPRPGYLIASNDYGTLELFAIGQLAMWLFGYSEMLSVLNSGRDIHLYTTSSVIGRDFEEMVSLKQRGDKSIKGWRALGKALNFALLGGLGVTALVAHARDVYNLRFCSLFGNEHLCGKKLYTNQYTGETVCAHCFDQGKELRAGWFSLYSEVQEYHNWIKEQIDGGYKLEVPGPREIGPGLIRGECGFTDGANLGFQGLAARLATSAWIQVAREMYLKPNSVLYGSRNLAFIHDEILSEHPIESASQGALRVAQIMMEEGKRYMPDAHALTVEPALMVRWTKEAESEFKYDEESGAVEKVLPIGQCPVCQQWGPVDEEWNMLRGHKSHNEDCFYSGRMREADYLWTKQGQVYNENCTRD